MGVKRSYTFTELLYAVVIGTVFARIQTLTPSQENILLVMALIVVFDDYLLYHHEVEEMDHSGKYVVLWFWLDMLVLGAWYALALSSKYSISTFMICLAAFFLCTSLWEFVFSEVSLWKRVIWSCDLPLVLTSIILATLAHWLRGPYWIYLIGMLPVIAWWRWPDWVDVWRKR